MNGSRKPVGRPPKVSFPIRRTVVSHGLEHEMLIEENTTVHCVRCGASFLVNGDTVFLRRTMLDDYPVVRCPKCNRTADAFYYLREPPRPPRIRTPEMVRIPWRTPEDW